MANILLVVIVVGLAHSGVSQVVNCGGRQCASNEYCRNDTETNREICVPKEPLGGVCTGAGQCAAMYSECVGQDGAMTCECGSLWTEGPELQCIINCENRNCSKNSFCSDIWHGCLPQVALDGGCNIDETSPLQCKTPDAVCEGDEGFEKCVCDFKEQAGICIPRCNATSCQEGLEFCNSTSGECVMKKSLGQACSDDIECMPDNSECGSEGEGACSCISGFQNYLNISCKPECTTNDDCTRGGEYCDLGNKYCVTKANLNEPCHVGSVDQCATPNANCDPTGVCACIDEFHEFGNQCVAYCGDHPDCQQPYEFCDLSTNVCESKRSLGDLCTVEGQSHECIDASNSTNVICKNLHCTCSDQYYQSGLTCQIKCTEESSPGCDAETEFCHDSGKCTPKVDLNGICKPVDGVNPCKTENAFCEPGTSLCTCETTHVEDSGSCILKCETNSDCTSGPDQFCNSVTGACEMKHDLNQVCHPAEPNDQCKDSNSACTENDQSTYTCSCKDSFAENNAICIATCQDSSTCGDMYCDKDGDPAFCKSKSPLGADCNYPDQCGHDHAECNAEKKCNCTSEYYNYNNGICLKKCTMEAGCLPSQFCQEDSGRCEKLKPLGAECGADFHCKTESAVCDSICQCPSTHWEENNVACIERCTKTTVCDPEAQFCSAFDDKCYTKIAYNQTCGASDDGYDQCLGKLTLCSELSETRWKCLCVENADKATVGCDCSDTYVESSNVERCLKEASKIGDECEEIQQCYTLAPGESNATECSSDNICACSPAYVGNGLETKCLRKATELLQPCEENKQCEGIGDGSSGSVCSNSQCSCPATYVPNGAKLKCLKEAAKIGDECEESLQCYTLAPGDNNATECSSDNVCACTADYVGNGLETKCLKKATELLQPCEENKQCEGIGDGSTGSVCSNSQCSCPATYVPNGAKLKCLKEAAKIGDDCAESQQCYTLAPGESNATECSSDNICTCSSDYVGNGLETKCLKKATELLQPCEESNQCEGIGDGNTGSQCTNRVCSCPGSDVPNGDKKRCLKIAENLQDGCEVDEQCAFLGGTGSAISKCVGDKCSCQTGFIDGSDKKKCLEMADKIEDPCDEIQQCSSLGEQIECTERKCKCKSGFEANDDKNQCVAQSQTGTGTRMGPCLAFFTIIATLVVKYFAF